MEVATKAFIVDSIATILVNASFSVQKLAHRQIERKEDAGSRAHCCNLTWWMGTLLMAIGTVIHLICLPYCDMTLLSANSTLAIIVNLMLSVWLFNEVFICKYDVPAMLLIIGGSAFIVLLANKKQN